MARYGEAYGRGGAYRPPGRGGRQGAGGRGRYDQESGYSRPWVGGYRQGYQGGSGGIRTGGAGPGRRYGGDYWWLGEHDLDSRGPRQEYDRAYRDFDRTNRPRFSPVGGMHVGMGGAYSRRRPPEALRDPRWFSEWTRWF
jgi:hypothetical protein